MKGNPVPIRTFGCNSTSSFWLPACSYPCRRNQGVCTLHEVYRHGVLPVAHLASGPVILFFRMTLAAICLDRLNVVIWCWIRLDSGLNFDSQLVRSLICFDTNHTQLFAVARKSLMHLHFQLVTELLVSARCLQARV